MTQLSGPIMDRIDIHLWIKPVPAADIVKNIKAESSADIAKRVTAARNIQKERFIREGIFTNAAMTNKMADRYCRLSAPCKTFLEKLIGRLGLSARAYSRIIRLARTVADLEGAEDIELGHISEAAGYRFLDKKELTI